MSYDLKDEAITGIDVGQPRGIGLLEAVRARCRVKHYSLRTERAYVGWIWRFIVANGKRHPRAMGPVEIETFLSALATRDDVAASTQNQALSALLFLYREVLSVDLPWMESVTRAKRPQKMPTVLSRSEVTRLLAVMDGQVGLMASLLYGTGMRLMECVRLRVQDVDFDRNEMAVRNGKGGKDRRVPLPRRLRERLSQQKERVRILHGQNLAAGGGEVYLPHALGRKYPNAGREFAWQYVFHAARESKDPGTGAVRRHHLDEGILQRAVKNARPGRHRQAGHLPYAAAFVRHPSPGSRSGHPHRPGADGPQGRIDHADLHPCAGPWGQWCAQSVGSSARRLHRQLNFTDN